MIYSLITAVLTLPASAVISLTPRGRKKLKERFGVWEPVPQNSIWLHGASVGEIQGLIPVIHRIKELNLGPILVTATSVTGLSRIEAMVEAARLLPFDSAFFLSRLVKKIKPKIFVFSETEIWPGLHSVLDQEKIPRLMINARVSEGSFKRFRSFSLLFSRVFSRMTFAIANDARSREHLAGLGVRPENSVIGGNTKYDQTPALLSAQDKIKLRNELFITKPLLVLGSLRPGEEVIWFEALQDRKAQDIVCIIAPRHQEKSSYFQEKLKEYGLTFTLKSELSASANIILADSMGDLVKFYQISEAAFVGATLLPDLGGHNPLEPGYFSVPIVIGSHGSVIEEVRERLIAAQACEIVVDVSNAVSVISRLGSADPELSRMGERGKVVTDSFRGASETVVNYICKLLKSV